MPDTITVTGAMEGRRLDAALELLLPDLGLRARKRLMETHRVLVDGRPRPKGYRVQAGQVLSLEPLDPDASSAPPDLGDWPGLRVVGQSTGRMAALCKPAGLDTEALAGASGPSLEAFLPRFFPGRFARLVNRLDRPVSGVVLAALSPESAEDYRAREDAGAVTKVYLALVHGGPYATAGKELLLDRAIDAAKRTTVRVCAEPDPTGLRHTRVRFLGPAPGPGLSPNTVSPDDVFPGAIPPHAVLARVVIHKGARHQIRAHLAHAGHPIVGDPAYGHGESGPLYLHHALADLPDFQAHADPFWPQWPRWEPLVRTAGGLEA